VAGEGTAFVSLSSGMTSEVVSSLGSITSDRVLRLSLALEDFKSLHSFLLQTMTSLSLSSLHMIFSSTIIHAFFDTFMSSMRSTTVKVSNSVLWSQYSDKLRNNPPVFLGLQRIHYQALLFRISPSAVLAVLRLLVVEFTKCWVAIMDLNNLVDCIEL